MYEGMRRGQKPFCQAGNHWVLPEMQKKTDACFQTSVHWKLRLVI
jgi:hypothetical protein